MEGLLPREKVPEGRMSRLQAAFRYRISKKELDPVKRGVLREAKIDCPLEFAIPVDEHDPGVRR
jgi:hypothetical protein